MTQMTIYNNHIATDSCRVDLDTYGDHTGMRALYTEMGLMTPSSDGYHIESDTPAIHVYSTL